MSRKEIRAKLNEIFCDVFDDGSLVITDGFVKVDREDTYIVKSDVDMDRPNYLGDAWTG